jgi:hypothetical protein
MEMKQLTEFECNIISETRRETFKKNKDNISRTEAYFSYYKRHPEIEWSFLASMVSRNGGYNMCDLQGEYFLQLLKPSIRERLFLTYERANWLIFNDVYPQLMIYDYSTKLERPMFHLLHYFNISSFIQREWENFWRDKNRKRLMTSLIINEQNVIQKPVIEHHVYRKKVFHSVLFQIEDMFHFSCVLFPTMSGYIYGASVNGFRNLSKRIDLGKRLANILFQPHLFPAFYEYANKQVHTGSRYDYERYFTRKMYRKTPYLRAAFPIINHHIHIQEDWSLNRRIQKTWLDEKVQHIHTIHLNEWYEKKQNQIMAAVAFRNLLR